MTAREGPRRPQERLDDDDGPYAAGYDDGWCACEDQWWPVIQAVLDLQEAFTGDRDADANAIAERMGGR